MDEESLLLLESGFRVANDFAELDNVDLATTRLDIMAHPRSEAPHILADGGGEVQIIRGAASCCAEEP